MFPASGFQDGFQIPSNFTSSNITITASYQNKSVTTILPPYTILYVHGQPTTINGTKNTKITYSADTDYKTAADNGLAAGFSSSNQGAPYSITSRGLSGGTMIIDKLVKINAASEVSSFTEQISAALSSTSGITAYELRYWDSGLSSTAPTSDTANNVIGTIDLKAGTAGTSISFNSAYNTNAGATASTMATVAKTAAGVKVQLIVTLIDSSTANASVSLQPTGIVLT
jgi:hypothetical protein